tara:strand:- start:1070 stop:2140 length:1071 start_codon:yes stop_codon:yes gene_type:complete
MKIGITGADGFIGYHTYTYMAYATDLQPIKLKRDFVNDERLKDCDWVIHLAGMNRGDDDEIYNTNIQLTSDLLANISEKTRVIFSSSTQTGSVYADSKKVCETMLSESIGNHKTIKLPNVFGPFGKPNYNSFVATFCHKLCNGEEPQIIQDNNVELIFVTDVVKEFISIINDEHIPILPTTKISVEEVLNMLTYYRTQYGLGGKIPKLDTDFKKHLFNTFRSYMNHEDRLFPTITHSDQRGELAELVNVDMSEGLVFTSSTNPGFTRGEHFHTRKFERFCVVDGDAVIRLRKIGSPIDDIIEYEVSGDDIKFIDMPIFYTHHIENVGRNHMRAIFWVSEKLDKDNPDTYFAKVKNV